MVAGVALSAVAVADGGQGRAGADAERAEATPAVLVVAAQACPPSCPTAPPSEGPCGPNPCPSVPANAQPCGARPCQEVINEGPCGPNPCAPPQAGTGPCGDAPCPEPRTGVEPSDPSAGAPAGTTARPSSTPEVAGPQASTAPPAGAVTTSPRGEKSEAAREADRPAEGRNLGSPVLVAAAALVLVSALLVRASGGRGVREPVSRPGWRARER